MRNIGKIKTEIIDIAINEGMPQAMKLFGETLQISKLDQQYMSKPKKLKMMPTVKNVSMKCWVGSNMKFVNIQNLIFQLMVSKT